MRSRFCYGLSALLLNVIVAGCSSGHNGNDTDHLVILHTNDTHSSIDPDSKDMGGIARRKVIIDSVRDSRCNVMLVDAGDAGLSIFHHIRR